MDSSSNPSQGSRAYIGLGANLGDALGALQAAVERLHALGRVAGASSVYETEPVGYTDQFSFIKYDEIVTGVLLDLWPFVWVLAVFY